MSDLHPDPVDLDRLETLREQELRGENISITRSSAYVQALLNDAPFMLSELRALRALRDAVADYQGRAYEHDDDIADLIDRAHALREGREL